MVLPVDLIFVPQGAEYKAVCAGLRSALSSPEVVAIPMGINSVAKFLKQQQFAQKRVLVMGLAGSLSSQYTVGNVVIYTSCSYITNKSQLITKICDRQITNLLQEKLKVALVRGLTSEKLIHEASEKQKLGDSYGLNVVDMESIAILNHLNSVAILRVISDNCDDNLPDLNLAINAQGKLDQLALISCFWRQPLAAIKLIKSSLKALENLKKITREISF